MSENQPRGDEWKETVSNPGHEHDMPKRRSMIQPETHVGIGAVEFRTDYPGERIVAREYRDLEDCR
jgi:hypothetical protein